MKPSDEIGRVVEKYSTTLLRIAMHQVSNRSEAQDVVQEVFLKYVQKAPDFHDLEHEKAWLMRTTMNTAHDVTKHWWKQKRNVMPEDCIQKSFPSQNQLLPFLRRLPKKYCYAIYLFYYEGYSTKEIAFFYDAKESTVSSWLFRGKKQLKKILEGSDINEELQL